MSKLDELIKKIEDANAVSNKFKSFNANEVNPILIELGGRPICKNVSYPGANDGSSISEVEMYITLLATRKLINRE